MRLMSQNEIQSMCVALLSEFDRLCQKHNLKYSLAYGTLLGAIRHKGFIPWDDDIDVVMPRDDYNKFIALFDQNEKYSIIYHTKNNGYYYPYMKMFSKDTIVLEHGKKINADFGIFIDIFPLDYCGHSKKSAIRVKDKLKNMEKYLLISMEDNSRNLSFGKRIYHKLIRIFPGNLYYQRLNRILNSFCYNEGILVNLVWGYDSKREVGAFTNLEETVKVSFENKEFNAIKDYDHFLKHIYNDYMKLPPKEKQVTHHDFDAYWKE